VRLQYTLRFGDYLLFNAAHQLLSVPLQVTYLFFAWLIYVISVDESGRLGALIAATVVYLIMWIFQMVFNVVYLYSSKNRSLLTKHIVEVQEEAFYDETQFNKSFHYWPGIAKVIKRPGFAAVYINSLAAHIIPRRAFSNEEEMVKFVAVARERIRASKATKNA
jgi:hypothetical protein